MNLHQLRNTDKSGVLLAQAVENDKPIMIHTKSHKTFYVKIVEQGSVLEIMTKRMADVAERVVVGVVVINGQ